MPYNPSPLRNHISKPIDQVHVTDLPAPWPAECCECDAVHVDRAHAERHREQSEHGDVMVWATDRDMDLLAIMDAYRRPVN